jgi:hypothetical protein
VVGVGVAWLTATYVMRRSRGNPLLAMDARTLSTNLAVFALAFAVVAAVPVIGWGFTSITAAPGDVPRGPDADRPDVIVLLLDAYPRADSLMDQFGVDNAGFEAELQERGFQVAHHSRSNYTSTWATLSSMFHGRPVSEIPALNPAPRDPAEQYRRVMVALEEAPVLQELRRAGYETVTVPSPFESAALTHADRILAPGELTSFEVSLLQHSLAGQAAFRVAPWIVFNQHRARIESTLQLVADEVARPSETPRFVFAHVLSPHPPVVYEADGTPAPPVGCFPDCNIYGFSSVEDWARFPAQLEHVNAAVLATLDDLIASDPEALVIVMSDHGSQRTGSPAAYALRNFFAARVPDGSIRYEDDVTPMSVLSRLTADGPAASAAPYRAWVSAPLEPLTMSPYTGEEP